MKRLLSYIVCICLMLGTMSMVLSVGATISEQTETNVTVVTVGDFITDGIHYVTADSTATAKFDTAYPHLLVQKLQEQNDGNAYELVNMAVPEAAVVGSDVILSDDPAISWYNHSMSQIGHADILTIMLGTNDAAAHWSQRRDMFENLYRQIVAAFRAINPDLKLYVVTSPYTEKSPYYANLENDIVPMQKALATDLDATLIDVYHYTKLQVQKNGERSFIDSVDMANGLRIHPGREGHVLMGDIVYAGVSGTPLPDYVLALDGQTPTNTTTAPSTTASTTVATPTDTTTQIDTTREQTTTTREQITTRQDSTTQTAVTTTKKITAGNTTATTITRATTKEAGDVSTSASIPTTRVESTVTTLLTTTNPTEATTVVPSSTYADTTAATTIVTTTTLATTMPSTTQKTTSTTHYVGTTIADTTRLPQVSAVITTSVEPSTTTTVTSTTKSSTTTTSHAEHDVPADTKRSLGAWIWLVAGLLLLIGGSAVYFLFLRKPHELPEEDEEESPEDDPEASVRSNLHEEGEEDILDDLPTYPAEDTADDDFDNDPEANVMSDAPDEDEE